MVASRAISTTLAVVAASTSITAARGEPARSVDEPKAVPALPAQGLGDLQAVCGKCHTLAIVAERRRTKADWVRVLEKMQNLGLPGTEAQVDGAISYIQRNLMAPS